MQAQDFKIPQRVWINNPSSLQPHHGLHGKVGIAVLESSGKVRLYFTVGSIHSMLINPLYLSKSN